MRTRRQIEDAAQELFARLGYRGTSFAAVAERAGFTPPALYRYFADKATLYEEVAKSSIDDVWQRILDRIETEATLRQQLDAAYAAVGELVAEHPYVGAFLAAVPIEARWEPRFADLGDRRSAWERRVFTVMAETALRTGELELDGRVDTVAEALRMVFRGWAFESHFEPGTGERRWEIIQQLVRSLDQT
ncbi:MAG: helix-turn-helix domain-containing protein [Actinomycetota bacterium]